MIPVSGYTGHAVVFSIARCHEPEIYREDLCFQAQPAVEKVIKAVFIARALPLPYVHDISDLLLRLERSGLEIPESVKSAFQNTLFGNGNAARQMSKLIRPFAD